MPWWSGGLIDLGFLFKRNVCRSGPKCNAVSRQVPAVPMPPSQPHHLPGSHSRAHPRSPVKRSQSAYPDDGWPVEDSSLFVSRPADPAPGYGFNRGSRSRLCIPKAIIRFHAVLNRTGLATANEANDRNFADAEVVGEAWD